MEEHLDEKRILELKTLLVSYFPDIRLVTDPLTLETEDNGEILHRQDQLLHYLQKAFFEEHLLEIQIDKSTRIFFAKILDDLPDLEEQLNNGQMIIVDPDYDQGSYLKEFESLVLTPLTPGIGNAHIVNSQQIICRYFSGTNAIEFGCTFSKRDSVRDIPVQRLNFPIIGRVNKNYRSFRVKAISSLAANVLLKRAQAAGETFRYPIVDVSALGLGFETADINLSFEIGEMVDLTIQVPEFTELAVRGSIRHVSKVRDSQSYKNICGVQFDLETRSLAAEIEKIAAAIQRMRIRENAEKISPYQGQAYSN